MAIVILRLGDVEITTSDPLTVRTLYRLMGSAVSEEDLAAVTGPRIASDEGQDLERR